MRESENINEIPKTFLHKFKIKYTFLLYSFGRKTSIHPLSIIKRFITTNCLRKEMQIIFVQIICDFTFSKMFVKSHPSSIPSTRRLFVLNAIFAILFLENPDPQPFVEMHHHSGLVDVIFSPKWLMFGKFQPIEPQNYIHSLQFM
jgi:hypothetical protein